MKILIATFFVLFSYSTCQAEMNPSRKLVGGPCEGCEAIFEFGEAKLASVDTLIDFNEPGPKLKVTGIVYEMDGKTSAKDVILYIYHTDQNGIYPTHRDENGWARRHGYIRGWVKTDSDGRYSFYTLRPGTYPSGKEPAHIHIILLEPDGKYYWIDSFYFADDPLLRERSGLFSSPRGGRSGVLQLIKEQSMSVGRRDIVLGRNIPGYE